MAKDCPMCGGYGFDPNPLNDPGPCPQCSQPTDDEVKTALDAFNKAINEPTMDACGRCDGKGYHHGFGEDGASPDWCSVCGGAGYNVRPGEEERAMRAALAAIRQGEMM